jgi:hypothetical protein
VGTRVVPREYCALVPDLGGEFLINNMSSGIVNSF